MGRKINDITGQIFNTWLVLKRVNNFVYKCGHSERVWLCRCLDCGREEEIKYKNLVRNKKCKCISEKIITKEDKHIYSVWRGMLERCRNPNHIGYKNYGGRGISVCKEWIQFETFKKWSFENDYRIGLSIDRINTDGNYEPINCRFLTSKEQVRNKRNNHMLIDPFDGEVLCMSAMAEKYNMSVSCLSDRINTRKIPLKEALEKPIRKVAKITDNDNNKITICNKIILWHDNNLKNGEKYTTKQIANEIDVAFRSLSAAITAKHNKVIADFLSSEFQYKKYKEGYVYMKNSNWNKDVNKSG